MQKWTFLKHTLGHGKVCITPQSHMLASREAIEHTLNHHNSINISMLYRASLQSNPKLPHSMLSIMYEKMQT